MIRQPRRFKSEHFRFYLVGVSRDLRTNKWNITCISCSKSWEPPTTMLAKDVITCPKCGMEEVVNYNNLKEDK